MSYHQDKHPVDMLRHKVPSVRDYFIGQALAGILANKLTHPTIRYARVEQLAHLAVEVADATIRRMKNKEALS